LNEDGTLRQSPWMRIIGEDYLVKAFEFAHEADPKAELYYNDFSLENEAKRDGAVRLLKDLKARGAKIAGVGLQGHNRLEWPTLAQQDAALTAFAGLGLKLMITELDVDVLPRATRSVSADPTKREAVRPELNPYTAGLPEEVQQALAKRYGALFAVYLQHRRSITRVTFWGVTDGDTWLNNFPMRGRTNHCLLFDREGKPKPAFEAVLDAARAAAR
jgi:endo-1,4-beta-xylanase